LCDFLLEDRTFELNAPIFDEKTANTERASFEQARLIDFLKHLPDTIYQTLDLYQRMERHGNYSYTLNHYERKRLLNYYQGAQTQPRGSLGYAWMILSRECIEQERDALSALQVAGAGLSRPDCIRLEEISQHLQTLKSVTAKSTLLQRVPIYLGLTTDSIKQEHLSQDTKDALRGWYFALPGADIPEEHLSTIMKALSSSTNEHDFIRDFRAYF
jgi:hypothetical protein